MKWGFYSQPVYASADMTTIDCLVAFYGPDGQPRPPVPFTASANDPEPHGRDIYAAIVAGAGKVPIGAYVAPAVPDLTHGDPPTEIG
jgi:hypothetical protein